MPIFWWILLISFPSHIWHYQTAVIYDSRQSVPCQCSDAHECVTCQCGVSHLTNAIIVLITQSFLFIKLICSHTSMPFICHFSSYTWYRSFNIKIIYILTVIIYRVWYITNFIKQVNIESIQYCCLWFFLYTMNIKDVVLFYTGDIIVQTVIFSTL